MDGPIYRISPHSTGPRPLSGPLPKTKTTVMVFTNVPLNLSPSYGSIILLSYIPITIITIAIIQIVYSILETIPRRFNVTIIFKFLFLSRDFER